MRENNKTFPFSYSVNPLCLCVSSEAGGELIWRKL